MFNDFYKTDTFPKTVINSIADTMKKQGHDVHIKWKLNGKPLKDDKEPNAAELSINNKWFLRQGPRGGLVKLSPLSSEQQSDLLGLLKQHNFYTRPSFTLGVVLTALYFVIALTLIAEVRADILQITYSITVTAMALYLVTLLLRANQPLPPSFDGIIYIFGVLALFFTIPLSILNVPLVMNLYKHSLYKRVTET